MVRVIAHRGASAAYAENTIEAFRAAREQGATGIELDVRLSEDEVLMVHHDAHLRDGRLIRSESSSDLPEQVPTLGQALEDSTGMWINIEIKNAPDEPDFDDQHRIATAVAGLVGAYFPPEDGDGPATPLVDRVMVSSFNVDSIRRVREVDPSIPLALLVWGQADPASLVGRAEGHGFEAIHPHDLLVDAGFVEHARRAGLQMNVWTVDDPQRIVQLAGLGVDGIITNRPDVAVAALTEAGIEPGS